MGMAAIAAVAVTGVLVPACSRTDTSRAASGSADSPAAVHQLSPGTNLSSVHVRAGQTYQLAAGARYTGTLNVDADNVTIQGSGSGRWPVITRHSEGIDITLPGRGDTVRWLRITGRGYAGKNGYIIGVDVSGQDATITNVSLNVSLYGDLYAGVYFERSASGEAARHSIINHCDALNPDNPGSGAFGVLLPGDHNTIENNTIKNQITASPVYGTDGSGVEVYHGRYNTIEGNTGSNDNAFTELGGAGATGNAYIGPGAFLITRDSGDKTNGPVRATSMTGDHVRGEVVSYGWQPPNGTLLTLRDNTISVPGGTALWTDGGFVNGGRNIVTGTVVNHRG
jgi:hypothetical protein